MISCNEIEQNLIDLLDGSITGERRVELEKHIGNCPACMRLIAAYQPLFDRTTGQASAMPSPEIWYRLQDKLNHMEESRPSRLRLPVHWRPVISLSVRSLGLVLAVAAGIFLGSVPSDSQSSTESDILDYYTTALAQASVSSGVDVFYQNVTGENGQ